MTTKKKIVIDKVNNELPAVYDADKRYWDQVADVIGLELEVGGVPVQTQRHLITSWAGMAAGIDVVINMLKAEHKRELARVRKYGEVRVNDKDDVIKANEDKAKARVEAGAFRAAAHVKDENQKALVIEELVGS